MIWSQKNGTAYAEWPRRLRGALCSLPSKLVQSFSKNASTNESTFTFIKKQRLNLRFQLDELRNHKNQIISFAVTILLLCTRLMEFIIYHLISFLSERFELKQETTINHPNLPAFKEISPPNPLVYKTLNPYLPLLPSVRILGEFCKFRYFCSYPNEFTAFRSFCHLHGRHHELQFVLEMVHIIDYVCQSFLNAKDFFDPQQLQLLLTFRELPRSILLVNGKFMGAARLPGHNPNEMPPNWVAHATLVMWHSYVLPTAPRQLACVRNGFVGAVPQDPMKMDLRVRFMKLIDVFAVAYASVEKLLSSYSIAEMKKEVKKKTNGTHILKSASMLQQWHNVRQFELNMQQKQAGNQ